MRVDYVADCIAGIIGIRAVGHHPAGVGMLAWIARAFPGLTDMALSWLRQANE